MQLAQLRSFLAVADGGQFTRAARALHIAQPSLSQQIRALEQDLGAELFVRARSGARLTDAGRALLPLARSILADTETARREVQEVADLRRGRLRVGGTPSLCQGVLADVVRTFCQRWPGVEVGLREGGSRDLADELDVGGLDVALLVLPLPAGTTSLAAEPLVVEELVVASGAGQLPPGDRGACTPADLRGRPLVLPRVGYDLREAAVAACRSAGFEPVVAVEGGELDAVLALVRAGVGLALLPATAARRSGVTVTRLAEPVLRRTIGLARRAEFALPRTAREFRAILLEHLLAAPASDVVRWSGPRPGAESAPRA